MFRLYAVLGFLSLSLVYIGCASSEEELVIRTHERLKGSTYESFYRWSISRRDERVEDKSYATFWYFCNDSVFVRFTAGIKEGKVSLYNVNEDSLMRYLGISSKTQLIDSMEVLAFKFFELRVLEVTAYPRFNGCTVFGLENTNKLLYFDPDKQCASVLTGDSISWLDDSWYYH